MQIKHDLQFHKHLLDAVAEAVIATDLDGVITHWNRGAEQLYGWSAGEARGHNFFELLSAEGSDDHAAGIIVRPQAGAHRSDELVVQRRDGQVFPALMTSSPIRDEQGVVIGIVTESIDLIERKRAEAERMQLTHHLGERIKELTALHGVAQVLHTGNPLPKTLEGVAAILQAAWQYPEVTGVRISFDSVEYQTPNYRQTPWKQESVVLTFDGRPNCLENRIP
jgi:PAS domain S-box-containing protein